MSPTIIYPLLALALFVGWLVAMVLVLKRRPTWEWS